MTNVDHENPEVQMFGLVERLKAAYSHLADILEKRISPAKRENKLAGVEPDSELRSATDSLLEMIDDLTEDIYQSLPSGEKISDQDKVVWSGSLRDLKFDYLGDNQFKIDGHNLLDKEDLAVDRTDHQVHVTTNKEVELSVEPLEHLETLTGIKVKIFRA